MSLPLCTCGHTAFSHTTGMHRCYEFTCDCLSFTERATQLPAIGNNGELENFIAAAFQQPTPWPDAAERRRYALLQAAAILLAGNVGNPCTIESCVAVAETLLVEIERRAHAQAPRKTGADDSGSEREAK